MKRKILIVTVLILSLLVASFVLIGCKDKNEEKGPQSYDIVGLDNASVSVVPNVTKATAGTEVKLTVTLKSKDIYLTKVLYNDQLCTQTATGYSFIMPEAAVMLSAETANYTEVLQNGFATYSASNLKQIAQNATHNSDSISDKKPWGLEVDFDTPYMSILKSKVTSSEQSVIPDSAIEVKSYTKADLGIGGVNDFEIVRGKVIVDTSKISVGETWLTMEFENGNVSSAPKSQLRVKIYVCKYGDISVATMTETLVFDVSGLDYKGDFNLRVADADHIDGSKWKAVQDYILKPNAEGKFSLNITYVKGHSFWLRLSYGTEDQYQTTLRIDGSEANGGVYTGDDRGAGTGKLTFTEGEVQLQLTVREQA